MTIRQRNPGSPDALNLSAERLRRAILERVRVMESRAALEALGVILDLLAPPHGSAAGVEALVSVARIVAGQRRLHELARRPRQR